MLGRGGFDLERIVALERDFLAPNPSDPGHSHGEHCDHARDATDHLHDSEIGSVALMSRIPMDRDKITRWLTELLATHGQDILRAKGIIDVKGEDRRLVFQAVHMLLEGDLQQAWRPNEPRYSRLVFIGRNLDRAALQAAFAGCTASA